MDMDRPSREGDLIAVVRELGIDSLGRTELVLRIERTFRVRLQVTAVAEMETVGDLLKAVESAAPGGTTAYTLDIATQATTPLIGQPDHAKTLTEMLDWH